MSTLIPYTIIRILGNDLPPCHKPGQTLENLTFILENEPPLPDCKKHWLINHVIDRGTEEKLMELLRFHGHTFTRLPFHLDVYAKLPRREEAGFLTRWTEFARRRRRSLHEQRARLNYATNNNKARNFAISHGTSFAQWVFPWDGNCLISLTAWENIRHSIARHKPLYLLTPMVRCHSNHDLDLQRIPSEEECVDEPQLGFNVESEARFDPLFYYGRRDKVELLWRLGSPGPWDSFASEPWDFPRPALAGDRHRMIQAGWVYRLNSGASKNRQAPGRAAKDRNRRREIACLSLLRRLNARAARLPSDAA